MSKEETLKDFFQEVEEAVQAKLEEAIATKATPQEQDPSLEKEPKEEGKAKAFDAQAFLKTVPHRPGSYRMYNSDNTVIYVGKAADLNNRLHSYFRGKQNPKTRALVAHIAHIEFTVTFSESEALILENELIKRFQPRYNILLRDDKSYPYLLLTSQEQHPGLYYHRGAKRKQGEYYGPFPDAGAVKESLRLLQRLFPLRQCENSVYAHRSRPCLLAQLGRCLAPCMKMSAEQEAYYQEQVDHVRLFLKGKNQQLLDEMTDRMKAHAQAMEFEQAALLRDQITALRTVQESSSVVSEIETPLDVVACAYKDGKCCVHVLFIRSGRVYGTRSYFPVLHDEQETEAMLLSFIAQFYLNEQHVPLLPDEIVLKLSETKELSLIAEAVQQRFNHEVRFNVQPRGARVRFLELAATNAQVSLDAALASEATAYERLEALEKLLNVEDVQRMECYDISHTQGELTVASCVVFGREGPETSLYRRYNIEGITGGDDFAAMHQVLVRRFREPKLEEMPDIVFIDGGRGQLHQAEQVLTTEVDLPKIPLLVGVAKGEGRKEGLETLIIGFTHERIHLDLHSPALQLVLHIRDESHRFAITGHRNRRSKARRTSVLEQIPGVGAKRRQALLQFFGGRQEIMKAGIADLEKVPGISHALACTIYDALHG